MRTPDYPSLDYDKWAQVDAWFAENLLPEDPSLIYTLSNSRAQGLPAHDVSALQGKMLALLIRMKRAVRILEIGTLGGYSTIWMAKALPEHGIITTIEFDRHHAEVALQNINNAGLSERIKLLTGAALDVLPTLTETFDFIFIDADKVNNPHYLEWAIKLSKKGSVIVADNTVRGGGIIYPESNDPGVNGIRNFVHMISHDIRLEATAIQTVGEKGWDGFIMAILRSK